MSQDRETGEQVRARQEDAQARFKQLAPSLALIYTLLNEGEALDINIDESKAGLIVGEGAKPMRKLVIYKPHRHYTLGVMAGKPKL